MTATNDQRRQDRAIPDGIAAVREAAKQAKLTARALLNTPNPTLNQIENARRNSR